MRAVPRPSNGRTLYRPASLYQRATIEIRRARSRSATFTVSATSASEYVISRLSSGHSHTQAGVSLAG